MKTRGMKLRSKIMICVFICIVLVMAVVGLLNYVIIADRLQTNYKDKAQIIATAVAESLDRDLFDKLTADTVDGA